MRRWILVLMLAAGCDDGSGKDTGAISLDDGNTECGSTMAFVSGSVTGANAGDPSLTVSAISDSGENVSADWYGEQGGTIAYELNLPAGSWSIQADTDACDGAAETLLAQSCQEHTVDLVAACR